VESGRWEWMVEPSSAEGVVAPTGFARRMWPAESRWLGPIRAELRGWLEPLALTEDDVDDVVLAVNEAATNSSRGRGIVLMRRLMTAAVIDHDGRGTRVLLSMTSPRHDLAGLVAGTT